MPPTPWHLLESMQRQNPKELLHHHRHSRENPKLHIKSVGTYCMEGYINLLCIIKCITSS